MNFFGVVLSHFGISWDIYIEALKKIIKESKMKKLVSLLIALIITLSALASPTISVSNDPSSNKTEQEIKELVAQVIGVISLESLADTEYIFIAVTEDGWIIVEIDGEYYIVPPEDE
jgi:hypothetical protein